MSKQTKTITATTIEGHKIRVSVPVELYHESTAGHRSINTGIIRIGYHVGRKWTVVRDYSIWTKQNGEVDGDIYTAYPNAEAPEFHYTDSQY